MPLAPAAMKGGGKWRGRAPRRTGHNLILRLATRKQDTLRFLHDPTVPFTNNQAERDGRMMKLRQKISGGFRSTEGAMDFALIRSFLSTAKKQGWNIIDALTCDPSNLAISYALRPSSNWAVTRFHMTLAGPVAPGRRDVVLAWMQEMFARQCGDFNVIVDRVALLRQYNAQAHFRLGAGAAERQDMIFDESGS